MNTFICSRALVIVCCLLTSIVLSACQRDGTPMPRADSDVLATAEHPVVSPSGRYALEVLNGRVVANTGEGSLMIARFRISQVGGKVVYEDDTDYALRHTTFILWADHTDQAWVYSGDIGTSYVDLDQATGKWTKHDFLPSRSTEPPAFLKHARGVQFGG